MEPITVTITVNDEHSQSIVFTEQNFDTEFKKIRSNSEPLNAVGDALFCQTAFLFCKLDLCRRKPTGNIPVEQD